MEGRANAQKATSVKTEQPKYRAGGRAGRYIERKCGEVKLKGP